MGTGTLISPGGLRGWLLHATIGTMQKYVYCWRPRLLLLAASTLLLPAARASGTYPGRPPQPPANIVETAQQYELGKAVFGGKAALTNQAASEKSTQLARLTALQNKLPAAAKKTVSLPDLAGKLSKAQMNALEYFLSVRYKIS